MINFFPGPGTVSTAVLRADTRLGAAIGSTMVDALADAFASRDVGAFLVARFALLEVVFFALVATRTI